jgi:hypothetical protein
MLNKANNTKTSLGGHEYPEMIMYWNFYQNDELITTKWHFYSFMENLSFLGGVLAFAIRVPSIIMLIFTFKLDEIMTFFQH